MRFHARSIVLSSLLAVLCWGESSRARPVSEPPQPGPDARDAFLVKPYLQLGAVASGHDRAELALLWHAPEHASEWRVEYQQETDTAWRAAAPVLSKRIAVVGIAPFLLLRAAFKDLVPGSSIRYRVILGKEPIFEAAAGVPKGRGQAYRFVAFGDCGAGTPEQRAIAYQTSVAKPDFVLITGDIVYSRGRVSEYRNNFWPVYNADVASANVGAPLMRSTLFVAAPGNHDIATRDLEKYPDGLAYFILWDQPRNGPFGVSGGPLVKPITGPAANTSAFVTAAGDKYPRMANFSFDYGNAHWTVLDSNPDVDWTAPELRRWVENDLATARAETWRFVAFHHPGFNSSKAHFSDQQMRMLADVFEEGGVDVVFNGHVHNYQRTFPLRFAPERTTLGKPVRDQNKVPGRWTTDLRYDGKANTRPRGVIYLVTGAGGNTLYNPEQQDDRDSWQSFTCRFVSKVHSMTVVDVVGSTLTFRQVTADGTEVDRFVVTK
jgi:3',5'-cyclic AMP phosphodiesterase CpdA